MAMVARSSGVGFNCGALGFSCMRSYLNTTKLYLYFSLCRHSSTKKSIQSRQAVSKARFDSVPNLIQGGSLPNKNNSAVVRTFSDLEFL